MGLFVLGPLKKEDKTPLNYVKACIAQLQMWVDHSDRERRGCQICSPVFKGEEVYGPDMEFANLYMLGFAESHLKDAIQTIEREFKSSKFYQNHLDYMEEVKKQNEEYELKKQNVRCKECGSIMKIGSFLQEAREANVLYIAPPGYSKTATIVKCKKCPSCGHSEF